jgi:glyceraldehyde 3-phosphate dehydrogenase
MQSLFARMSFSRNVDASPDATSTTGCALSRNYKARGSKRNPDARTGRYCSVRHLDASVHARGMFMTRVAINGLGRIGRATLKILMDTEALDLVAANDIAAAGDIAYLLKYDTVYGRYDKAVEVTPDAGLSIGGRRLTLLREKEPARLPWKSLNVDIVFECTGRFTARADLDAHVRAGARYVILSAPSNDDDVDTIVHGVNTPHGATNIISCASCTTNCITPVMEVLGRRIGITKAIMTTVHAYTASQTIVDSPHKHPRRGRAGAANLVPTSTGAAIATTKALPEYRGRFGGAAIRAPVTIGSLADIVAVVARPTTVNEVNQVFSAEAESERYRGVLGVTTDPLVSSDIIKDSRASVVDLNMTQVVDGDLVKVMSWYDNEWGYSNQLVREAVRIGRQIEHPIR